MDNFSITNAYKIAWQKAQQDWQQADPQVAAGRADATYLSTPDGAQVILSFFGKEYRIPHPQGPIVEADTGREASPTTQILLLHYLLTADGTLPTGQWVSFHELPHGHIYHAAFAARSLAPLTAAFGLDRAAFVQAGTALGGEPMRLGDASFWFRAFPRLPVAVVLWLGEEDLPGQVNILFDSAAGHYLPTEDLAAVGGILSNRLLRIKLKTHSEEHIC